MGHLELQKIEAAKENFSLNPLRKKTKMACNSIIELDLEDPLALNI